MSLLARLASRRIAGPVLLTLLALLLPSAARAQSTPPPLPPGLQQWAVDASVDFVNTAITNGVNPIVAAALQEDYYGCLISDLTDAFQLRWQQSTSAGHADDEALAEATRQMVEDRVYSSYACYGLVVNDSDTPDHTSPHAA